MVTPGGSPVDPQLVARLSGDFAALGQHMRAVAEDLTRLRSQLETPPAVPPAAQPSPPQPASPIQPAYPQQPLNPQPLNPQALNPQALNPQAWNPQPWYPQQPWSATPVAPPSPVTAPSPVPTTSAPRREPWWQRDGVISRALAVAGGAVTLIGVVMLLVLAAQAGFFGPVARVVAGGVFSAALVVAGVRVHRLGGGRVGAIALVGTGIAGGFLDVVAATSYYGWFPPALGLALAAAVAAGGMTAATRWDSQPMAALTVTAVAVLAPALADGPTLTLLSFLVLLQIAAFVPQLGRDWPYLHVARTLPVVLALLVAFADATWGALGVWPDDAPFAAALLVALAATVAVVGVGTSVVLLRRAAGDVTATVMLTVSTLPVLLSGGVLTRWAEVAVQCSLAAGLLVVLVSVRGLPTRTRAVVAAVAALAVLQASVGAAPGDVLPVVLLVLALGLVAVAGRARSRIAYVVGLGFGVLGGLLFLDAAPPDVLSDQNAAPASLVVIVSGVLLAALAGLLVVRARELDLLGDDNVEVAWIAAGVVAVYGGTAAIVTAGVAALGADPGFIAGHCAATLVWMLLATALLRWGLMHPNRARTALGTGLAVTGVALAKLFLFDLATLDGLIRVLAFLGVGLLLLAAGTRYARAFAGGAAGTGPEAS